MGLLGEIYNAFGLVYTIAVAIIKHEGFSSADVTLMIGTGAFVILSGYSFVKKVRAIPSGYRCTFFWKSLARGDLGLFLSLFYYPIRFCCGRCDTSMIRALTFSNEAYDGVEKTRQLEIFELTDDLQNEHRYKTKHSLFWYGEEEKWGYERLVGGIWVKVKFKAEFNIVENCTELQTSDWGMSFFLQYKRARVTPLPPTLEPIIEIILQEQRSVNNPNQGSVHGQVEDSSTNQLGKKFFSRLLPLTNSKKGKEIVNKPEQEVVRDLERGSNPEITGNLSGTPPNHRLSQNPLGPSTSQNPSPPPTSRSHVDTYWVTITREPKACEIKELECCGFPYWTRNQPSSADQNWTLFQIHQYVVCLDAWGNHPKQGIWKTSNGGFRYCYRHDELITAIGNNMLLTKRRNDGTSYTVV